MAAFETIPNGTSVDSSPMGSFPPAPTPPSPPSAPTPPPPAPSSLGRFIVPVVMVALLAGGLFATMSQVQKRQKTGSKAAGSVELSMTVDNSTGGGGKVYYVSINVDTKDKTISAAELHLSFPSDKFEAASMTAGSFLPVVLTQGKVEPGKASIIVGSQPTEPKRGTGQLAVLKLISLQAGTSQIQFDATTQIAAIGENGNAIASTNPLTITVDGNSTSPPPPPFPPTELPGAVSHWPLSEGQWPNITPAAPIDEIITPIPPFNRGRVQGVWDDILNRFVGSVPTSTPADETNKLPVDRRSTPYPGPGKPGYDNPGLYVVKDIVGQNDGKAIGTTFFFDEKYGMASRQFNGTSDYISFSKPASLNISGSETVSMWVNFIDLSNYTYFYGDFDASGTSSQGALRAGWQGPKLGYYQKHTDGSTLNFDGEPIFKPEGWYFIAFVRNDETKKVQLYVDGKPYGDAVSYAGKTVIGYDQVGSKILGRGGDYVGNYFHGRMSDVWVFNRALSPTDIARLHRLHLSYPRPSIYPPSTPPPNCIPRPPCFDNPDPNLLCQLGNPGWYCPPNPPGNATLSLTLKLQGRSIFQPGLDQTALLKLKQGEATKYSTVLSMAQFENGIYMATASGVPTGTYDLYIKSRPYLQKKFSAITIIDGHNSVDLTGQPLLAGDINGDGRIDSEDIVFIIANYFKEDEPEASLSATP